MGLPALAAAFGAHAVAPPTVAAALAFLLLLLLLLLASACQQGIAIVLWSCASTRQAPPRPLADRLVDRYLPLFRKRLVSE